MPNLADDQPVELAGMTDMTHMTIAVAQKFYQDHSEELREDLRSMVRIIREAGVRAPLQNSNYLHALSLTSLMFEETSRTFRMLTGGALDGFFAAIGDEFKGMLHRIRSHAQSGSQAFAKVLVVNSGNPLGSQQLEQLVEEFADVLQVVECNVDDDTAKLFPHFIACDGDMVREEKFHAPLTPEADANTVKAQVFFYEPSRAQVVSNRFDVLWDRVSK